MNKREEEILEYLEQSYSGAKMMDDESCQVRLARAIAAFNSNPEVSAFALSTNKFITEYCTEWGEVMELPVRFVYAENGKEKSSIDENKRMNEIDQLNKDLHKWYIDARSKRRSKRLRWIKWKN